MTKVSGPDEDPLRRGESAIAKPIRRALGPSHLGPWESTKQVVHF